MPLTIVTKGSTLDVGRDPETIFDIPNKEKLLKFSKSC